jgi:hypothetical protein
MDFPSFDLSGAAPKIQNPTESHLDDSPLSNSGIVVDPK